jgi:hypothetical protein
VTYLFIIFRYWFDQGVCGGGFFFHILFFDRLYSNDFFLRDLNCVLVLVFFLFLFFF